MHNIRGLQALSLIDYPKELAAVVFLAGCNFRCGYCHNPDLVRSRAKERIEEKDFFAFLEKRKGLIDAVVITGGEPTLSKDLIPFLQKIKAKGFLIKLDTNGSRPQMLYAALPYIDYIAMDIKASVENYTSVAGNVDVENIKESVEIIRNAKKDYEFRTTLHPALFSKKDLENICLWLKGSKKYVLQQFLAQSEILDPTLASQTPFSPEELLFFKSFAKPYFDSVELRNV